MSCRIASGRRLRILQLLIAHGERTAAELLDLDPELPRGTIYTTLDRLRAGSFVRLRVDTALPHHGRARPKWRVTRRGRRLARLGEEFCRLYDAST